MADPKNTREFFNVSPMTDFEFDEVVSILLGVKPPAKQKSPKQKSSKKSKKLD